MNKLCSLLVPTRWRPKMAEDCVRSIFNTAEDKNRIEVIVRMHADDQDTLKAKPRIESIHPNIKCIVSGMEGTWQALARFHGEMIEQASGQWLWFLNDDVTFEGDRWDSELAKVPMKGCIVYPEFDLLDHSRYAKTIGGPFPCVPNGSWGEAPFGKVFGGFNVDTSLHYHYFVFNHWTPTFIPGLTINHHRLEGMKHRKDKS